LPTEARNVRRLPDPIFHDAELTHRVFLEIDEEEEDKNIRVSEHDSSSSSAYLNERIGRILGWI
jgi:hypothetical protein